MNGLVAVTGSEWMTLLVGMGGILVGAVVTLVTTARQAKNQDAQVAIDGLKTLVEQLMLSNQVLTAEVSRLNTRIRSLELKLVGAGLSIEET